VDKARWQAEACPTWARGCLAPFQQIRRYRILERDFSVDEGELTATLKLRRGRLLEQFRDTIAELYAGKA